MPRILFVTPELSPWIKSGGLGDVSHSLPRALRDIGLDVRILVPAYPSILAALPDAHSVAELAPGGGALPAATLLEAQIEDGLPLLLLDCPPLYRRAGSAYQSLDGIDFPDNALRFGLLCRTAALLGSRDSPLPWHPELLHCNDWPCGLAPAYLHFERAKTQTAATLMTVHNLAFQGNFAAQTLAELGLPPEAYAVDGVEFWGQLSFMKAGLQFADAISTVSPRYATEIQEPEFGCGLDGLLRERKADLYGVLNGIDENVWNPATDSALPQCYDYDSIEKKAANKEALQRRLGLTVDAAIPLLGSIGRITHQKGLDLLPEIADKLAALPAQLALLGTGEKALEARLVQLAERHPGRVAIHIGFDETLAHLIEAGADIFLMPSRFEPCGLNQLYSLRYGTPPVVRFTGGLADTVVDCTAQTLEDGTANGYCFQEISGTELLNAIVRATSGWHDPALWHRLQAQGMRRDSGWKPTAGRYRSLYDGVLNGRRYATPGAVR